jgi:hypothetical protein
MNTKLTSSAVFVLSILLFHSCSTPKNVLRLLPEKKSDNWLYGQQFISDSIDGVIYEVGFDQATGGRYWFDFTVTNRSNLPVMIDPLYFYIQPFDGVMKPLTEKKVPAVDPEYEILEIEKQISRNNAFEKNILGIVLAAAAVDVATEIALAADDNPENDHLRTHLVEHSLATFDQNPQQVQSLFEIKGTWETTTIRKTKLNSNCRMKGKVFFPAFPEAVHIKLYLPVDSEFLELGYMQIHFPVR